MKRIQGTRVTVLGAARSGCAAARLLHAHGAEVLLSEARPLTGVHLAALQASGIALEVGGHTARALETDVVVLSPGVPSNSAIPQAAAARGIPCYSELEVASWFCQGTMVAITGSNGKTTTTALIGHIFSQAGYETVVAGNIGTPLSIYADRTRPETIIVVEVSSFQLDHIKTLRPKVSVLLNITPDHLDRYDGDFESYAQSKLRIAMNQSGTNDIFVYNYDDTRLRAHALQLTTTSGVQAIPFSYHQTLSEGASLHGGTLVLCLGQHTECLLPAKELALPGPHNVQNSMAAAIVGRVMDIPAASLRESLRGFEGVAHRLELVREVGGVRYVNDSKATNVNAVWYALQTFAAPLVLLAGGRDKGNDYAVLKPHLPGRVRTLIAFGESRDTIMRELGPHAGQMMAVETLEEATRYARACARPGDVVLLSPACASFDLFENYEHRGDTFKALVNRF